MTPEDVDRIRVAMSLEAAQLDHSKRASHIIFPDGRVLSSPFVELNNAATNAVMELWPKPTFDEFLNQCASDCVNAR